MEPEVKITKSNMRKKNTKKIILISSIVIVLILNLILFAAGNHFYNVVINYNKSNNHAIGYTAQAAKAAFNVQRYNTLQKENVTLQSRYGYQIKGVFIKNSIPTKNTVVLVHGIGMEKWNSLKYGDIFLDEGYNIFIYDSRDHGETGGDKVSYGYYEQDDLQTCVKYVKEKNKGGIIGIHGESLGAATCMLYLEKYADDNDVLFLVEDCGWSDLNELYIYNAKDYNVPALLRPVVVEYLSFVCKLRSGFFLEDVSTVKNIDKIKCPILFIHGDSDTFIPTFMVYELYNARKTGVKYLYVSKGADHAESLKVDKVRYKTEVINFLDSVFKGKAMPQT